MSPGEDEARPGEDRARPGEDRARPCERKAMTGRGRHAYVSGGYERQNEIYRTFVLDQMQDQQCLGAMVRPSACQPLISRSWQP